MEEKKIDTGKILKLVIEGLVIVRIMIYLIYAVRNFMHLFDSDLRSVVTMVVVLAVGAILRVIPLMISYLLLNSCINRKKVHKCSGGGYVATVVGNLICYFILILWSCILTLGAGISLDGKFGDFAMTDLGVNIIMTIVSLIINFFVIRFSKKKNREWDQLLSDGTI